MSSSYDELFFQFQADAFDIAKESNNRNDDIANSIRDSLTAKQLQVVVDPSYFKAALCPRRAGKSHCAMSYALDTALRKRRAKVAFVTLTLKSARGIYWDEFRRKMEDYGIAFSAHKHDQLFTLASNNSQIMLVGAESMSQIDKLRGQQFDLVVLDECKSFPEIVLNELIYDVIAPALLDRRGSLLMIGTPGSILQGPFFQATYPGAKNSKTGRPYSRTYDAPESYWIENPEDSFWSWSRHEWTIEDNPHLDSNVGKGEMTAWELALDLKIKKGWDDNHPTWQREYLGRWVASEDTFVYTHANLCKTAPEIVYWDPADNENPFGLPHAGPWYYILGLDMGFVDDFAMVIAAYSPFDNCLYHVYDFKEASQDIDQIAAHIDRAHGMVGSKGFLAIVADEGGSGSKNIFETYRRRYGWNIQPAQKADKQGHISVFNSDSRCGRIKLIPMSDLDREMMALQWDTGDASLQLLARTGKLKEHPSMPNHLCFVAGTSVLTSKGIKPIEAIEAGELVLTHTGSWKPVKHRLARQYSGPVLTMRFAGHEPFTCTPEHELMGVTYKRSTEGDLTGQQRPYAEGWVPAHSFEKPKANAAYHTRGKIATPPLGIDSNPLQAFLDGYYAAEGSCSPKAGGVSLAGHRDEKQVLDILRQYNKKFKWRDAADNSGRTIYIYKKELVERYRGTGKSTEKRVVDHNWDFESLHALLEGYFHGDGHLASTGIKSSSVSKTLSYQIWAALRSLGYSPSICHNTRSHFTCRGKPVNDNWQVTLTKSDTAKFIENSRWPELWTDKTSHPVELKYSRPREFQVGARLTEKTESQFDGTVYTLEVEDDHSYTVNGIVAKNCDAFLYLHRFSYHYWADDRPDERPEMTAQEIQSLHREQAMEALLKQRQHSKNYSIFDAAKAGSFDPLQGYRNGIN